jgi:excisionase family DNA binding protein
MAASDVSLREAAEILGVHYMTAYRHVRTGRLPARLVGGEGRIDRADLQAAGQRAPAPRSPRRPGTASTCRRLGDRLVAGDEAGAWSLIQDAMVGGLDPVAVHIELLAPAMRSIGDGWQSGALSVGDEHRATSVAQRLVGRLGPRFVRPGRTRGAVVLAGAAGDPHSLPIAMAADVVRAAGYAVIDLGSDVPPDSLALAAARADRLVAVGISAATAGGEDAVRQAVAVVRATVPDVAVLVGGPAMDAELAAAIGADGFAPDAVGLVRLLDELRSPT